MRIITQILILTEPINQGMTRAEQLNIAQANKKDEFYTQLIDIEKELVHYKKHFEGKTVYCNCDDPRTSNFVLFFKQRFNEYRLKKLVCTCYKEQNADLFANTERESALYMEYDGTEDSGKIVPLRGDGDFRNKECLRILAESDIIVTNPPFSLFRDFLNILDLYKKSFLIIGNVNAISYKECFSMIQDGRMWLGCTIHSGDREFLVPREYPLNAAGVRVDSEGNKFIRVKGVRWFTNLEYAERFRTMLLTKQYTPDAYPKFDNYDAINVDKTKNIPSDYSGVMGVPITFLDKFNPQQFAIIGNEYSLNIAGALLYKRKKNV